MFANKHLKTQNTLSKTVSKYYAEKTNDRNLIQAKDGYVHHHFGLGPTENIDYSVDLNITQEIQRQENKLTSFLIKLLSLDKKHASKVIDLGCGRGGNLFRILKEFHNSRVDGINITKYQANYCINEIRKRDLSNRSEVRHANFLSIPYPDRVFTHAYCCEVTQYVLNLVDLFREIYRVLQERSRFVVATWCYDDEFPTKELKQLIEPINEHYASTMHSYSSYKKAFKDCHFDIAEEHDQTEKLIDYWELRKQWSMQSGIEDCFINGHKRKLLLYKFFVLIPKKMR